MMFRLFRLRSDHSRNAWPHDPSVLMAMFRLFRLPERAHTHAYVMVFKPVGTVGTVGTYMLSYSPITTCVFRLVFRLAVLSRNILHLLGRPWGVLSLSCDPAPLDCHGNKGADARRLLLTLRVGMKLSPAMAGGFAFVHPEGVCVIDRHIEGLSMVKELPRRAMGPPRGGWSDVGASSNDIFARAVVQRDGAGKGGGLVVSKFTTGRGA